MHNTRMHDTCADIMIAQPVILRPDITLNEAFHTIHNIGVRYLPVVNDDGDFVGIFSSMTLLKLLLPNSVSITRARNPLDLAFMYTSIEELQERLKERGQEPITDYILTENLPVCTPKTSIMEALYILYKNHYHVVITAPNSKKFLGVVTIHGVLEQIKYAGNTGE